MIMLPVPDEHYTAMVQELARLMAGSNTVGVTTGSGTLGAPSGAPLAGGEWPATELRRLKDDSLNAVSRVMLDLTAERPEQRVGRDEIKKRSGVDHDRVRGQLAAFTKLLLKHYGRRWPIHAERNARGEICYVGSKQFAAEWTRKP
jgi:hypothetical protein